MQSFGYRELPRIPHLKQERRTAHILGTMFWFSALMTAYIEPDKIYVSRCFPYAQEFTDPELGIPSDDQGLAPVKENPKNYKTRSLIRPQNFPPTIVKSYYGVTPYEG